MASASYYLTERVTIAERRRAVRRDISLGTMMADREGRSFSVRILNLSQEGFMVQSEWSLCERAPVRIDIPTIGWLRAEISWVLGDRVGGSFRDVLEPNAFATFVNLFGEQPSG